MINHKLEGQIKIRTHTFSTRNLTEGPLGVLASHKYRSYWRKKESKNKIKTRKQLKNKVVGILHLMFARLKKYAVVAISGLAELVNERQIMFLNDASEQTSSANLEFKSDLIELAFLDRVR